MKIIIGDYIYFPLRVFRRSEKKQIEGELYIAIQADCGSMQKVIWIPEKIWDTVKYSDQTVYDFTKHNTHESI